MMGTEDDDTTSEEGVSQVCSPLHFYEHIHTQKSYVVLLGFAADFLCMP